jgi:hypothetical protein
MASFTSFNAADLTPQGTVEVLRDYLALDRARFWRRLLVGRFGLLALTVFVVGRVIPGLSAYGRWGPVLLFLVPPAWAWLAELRLTLSLSHRLPASASASSYTVVMDLDPLEGNQ